MDFNTPKISNRIQRMSVAFVIFLFAIGLAGLSIEMGLSTAKSSYKELLPETLILAISCIAIYWALVSGFSQRFKDPKLSLFQIIFSIAWITYAVYLIQVGRGIMLCTYMLVIFFGAFRLETRGFILITLLAITGFAGVLAWEHLNPPPNYNSGLNVFLFLAFTLFLTLFALLAGHVRKLRDKLSQEKQAVEISYQEIATQRDELKVAYAEMQDTMKHLGEIASRDELTGLFNRRQFTEVYRGHLTVARATGEVFALALLDIDHFKKINDNYGHTVGDKVLVQFAELAQGLIRDSDFIARYGGEEFAILFTTSNKQKAIECVERVRNAFARFPFDDIQEGLKITVSTGISHFSCEETADEFINRADKALYRAKREGRNKTVYLDPPQLPAAKRAGDDNKQRRLEDNANLNLEESLRLV